MLIYQRVIVSKATDKRVNGESPLRKRSTKYTHETWITWINSVLFLLGSVTRDRCQYPDLYVYIEGLYKAYVREHLHKIWPYMVQYLHFRILKFPLIYIYIIYYPITTTGISNCPMPRHALNGLKRVTFGKLSLPWSHQLIIFRTPKEVVHTITRTYGMKPLVPHSRQAEIQVVFNQLKKKHTKIQHILSDNVPVFLPCLPVFFLCYCYFVLFF